MWGGTIDQALLSVLPTKFQTLRHFALSSKILIVDEVHELGEPYIDVALTQLLRLHRAAGGSAILVTATLPLAQRRKLMEIYDGGDDDPAYPSLSIAGAAARRDLPQATSARGPVRVERLPDTVAAIALLADAADLPANTQFLSPRLFMTNRSTAAAVAYDCSGVYVETDL